MKYTPSDQALSILKKRYFKNDEDWPGLCTRVSEALAKSEEQKIDFYSVMVNGLFLPNSPCLMNAGKNNGGLSACFVLPIEDSIESIFSTLKNAANIYKDGGGVGINFSTLRPEGATVHKTGGVSSGPISFMKIFNEAIMQVKQGGTRRGAAIGLLGITHPDIINFIKCKDDESSLNNFNISVMVTDEFMKKVKSLDNTIFETFFGNIHFYIDKKTNNPIKINYDKSYSIEDCYTYKDVWNLIVKQAWKNGEPGLIFIDEIKDKNGINVNAVNPCGESPLEDWEACVLGSIDVSKLINGSTFDFDALQNVTKIAVDFLNNIVDLGRFPLKEIENKVKNTRKIGLGIMGWADALLRLKIRYGSNESLILAKRLMCAIKKFAKKHSTENNYANHALTAIAPTGSLSIFAGCSSGLEPNFAWTLRTNRKDFGEQIVHHKLVKTYLEKRKNLPEYFVTTMDVPYEDHVKMQAVFQENGVDLGVSKTINLPTKATKEEISSSFILAWELKCKGVTVYRDGCRENQVLSVSKGASDGQPQEQVKSPTRERSRVLFGATYQMSTPVGKCYINITEDVEGIREVFVTVSKSGSEIMSHTASEGRLISNSLQYRVPAESIIAHLKNQKSSPVWDHGRTVKSIPDAIAQAMEHYTNNYEGFSDYIPEELMDVSIDAPLTTEESLGSLCGECGELMVVSEGGCEVCKSCGFSRCG